MTPLPTPRYLNASTPPHISTLVLLAGMSALSMNVFLPSLPKMATHFDTSYGVIQLSVSGFLLMSAFLQIIVGPLSDRYGRRPVVLWSLVLFILATFGCIYAPTIEAFLTLRMVQAVSVAGIVLSRAAVRDMVPPEKAASMIGYVTMGMSLVPMVGPAIGGVLDAAFNWQASFVLLGLVGIAVLFISYRDMGETNRSQASNFRDQVRDYPELLSSRRFWGYCLSAAFCSGAYFAYLGGGPLVGAETFGLSPEVLGICFGAPALGYMAGNYISGRYSERFGINRMILAGASLVAIGMVACLALFLLGLGNAFVFFGAMPFVGLGNGMALPNATSGMLSVRPHLAGTASGLGGAMMTGGGAALAAGAGAMFSVLSGAIPLIVLMLVTALMGLFAIAYVIRREKSLG